MAVVTVVATLTFGSSLQTLVVRPDLYGWNWTYALQPVGPSERYPNSVRDPREG